MSMSRNTVLRTSVAAAALAAAIFAPSSAHAWWRGGIGFGFFPVVPFAYPYYAPPPVYYGPPPVVYAPQQQQGYGSNAAPGQACYAGPYVCPLANPSPAGSPCSCPTNENGRAGGRVG